jgi:methylated-DNA-protein-cysteine methyltransferase related protein
MSVETKQPESTDFFERVLEVVARIPFGRVTTYGHIAEHLGMRSSARMVGWALHSAAGSGLPAHRVVNRFGALSGRMHFEGPYVMEERLRSEGVTFTDDDCVDLSRHLWVPGRDG